MIIEDFVMLGRTEPTQSKKHGIVVLAPTILFNLPWRLCSVNYATGLGGH
jgi:hypothetical protein